MAHREGRNRHGVHCFNNKFPFCHSLFLTVEAPLRHWAVMKVNICSYGSPSVHLSLLTKFQKKNTLHNQTPWVNFFERCRREFKFLSAYLFLFLYQQKISAKSILLKIYQSPKKTVLIHAYMQLFRLFNFNFSFNVKWRY